MKYPDTLPWWINTRAKAADEIYCDKGAIADTWSDVGDISDKEAVEHAQYIVTACNMFPDLVQALENLRNAEWMVTHDWGGDRESVLFMVDKVLAKIKET